MSWNKLLKSGLIDADSAMKLRDEVWHPVGNAHAVVACDHSGHF
jgi:hypothetical protein